MYRILAILILICSISPANAQYAVGYINSDGYTWDGSYWMWNHYQYTRSAYSTPGYYYCGYYYPGVTKYNYTLYQAPMAQIKVYGGDANIIANAVAARDVVRNRIIESQQAYTNLIGAVKSANLDQALPYYATGTYQSAYSTPLYGSYGVNTSTVYGYNASLAQTINPFAVNLDQAFLSYAQLAQGQIDSSKEISTAFGATINSAATQSAQLSGIAARRDAIVAFSKMLDGPPSSSNTIYRFSVAPGGKISMEPGTPLEQLPGPRAKLTGNLQERWNQAASSCVKCHHGDKGERKEGGFALAEFPNFSPEQKRNVLARLELPASDPKHMPKGGPPVSLDEYRAWVELATQPANKPDPPPK